MSDRSKVARVQHLTPTASVRRVSCLKKALDANLGERSPNATDLPVIAGLVVAAGGAARIAGIATGRAAGGARIPELAPPGLPLPNGLERNGVFQTVLRSSRVNLLAIASCDRIVVVSSCVIRIEEFLEPLNEFEIILKFAFD